MDALYERLIAALNGIGLVYIHIVDHRSMGAPEVSPTLKAKLRAAFKGSYILSGGYVLVRKMQSGNELVAPDAATFYTPGEKGYTDY